MSLGFTLCLPLLFAPVQDAKRAAALGRVLDTGGRPWSGARVILVSNVFDGDFDELDRVEATSDAQGRLRAKLLADRRYTAWATQDSEGGTYRTSVFVDGVQARASFELRETARHFRTRYRVTGLGLWKERGPFRLQCFNRGAMLAPVEVAVDDEGEALIPRFPSLGSSVMCELRVLDARGRLLLIRTLQLQPAGSDRSKAKLEVELPPPFVWKLRVRDKDDKPIAGATISVERNGIFYRLGETAADGTSSIELATRVRMKNDGSGRVTQTFHVRAPGFAGRRHYASARIAGEAHETALDVELEKAVTLRGRILRGEGEPAAGMPLALFTSIASGKSATQLRRPLRFECTADGSFEIPRLSPRFAWRLLALDGTLVWLGHGTATGRDVDLETIRLDRLRAVEVRVFSAIGEPAAFCELVAGDPSFDRSGRSAVRYGLPLVANRLGRARLRLATTDPIALAAGWRGGFAHATFDASKSTQSKAELELRLSPTVRCTGRVLDENGDPVAHAKLSAMYARLTRRAPYFAGLVGRNWQSVASADGRWELSLPANATLRISARQTRAEGPNPRTLHGDKTLETADKDLEAFDLVLGKSTLRRGVGGVIIGRE